MMGLRPTDCQPLRKIAIFVIFSTVGSAARADALLFPDPALAPALEAAAASALASASMPAAVPLQSWDHAVPYANLVRDAAKAANVRPGLLHALITAESGYRPGARS